MRLLAIVREQWPYLLGALGLGGVAYVAIATRPGASSASLGTPDRSVPDPPLRWIPVPPPYRLFNGGGLAGPRLVRSLRGSGVESRGSDRRRKFSRQGGVAEVSSMKAWPWVLGGVAVYLAIPLVRRMGRGCPPVSSRVAMIPQSAADPPDAPRQTIEQCPALGAGELLLWPLGFFVAGK